MLLPQLLSPAKLTELQRLAGSADEMTVWPAASWELVRTSGALRWIFPEEYGGLGLGAEESLHGYETLAGACLTTCFILTQCDAAFRRIIGGDSEELRRELLPRLCSGEWFTTVGLSQLTTSRQHGQPVFSAREDGNALIFNGMIPWVTGASQAQILVIGASLENGQQVLAALPTDMPGVRVGPPLELLALRGSLTAAVHCDNVRLARRWLLAGPVANVMTGERGGAGGLQTSCLAIGLAGAAIEYLKGEAKARPGLLPGTERLEKSYERLRQEMFRLARDGAAPDATNHLRAQANTLALQATQAGLIASKGTGFVHPHPAQRWARQALFFLVWSCPWPAASATLDYITFAADQECLS